MPWNEKWRSEDRPASQEIPDEYRLTANAGDNRIMGYFGGVLVLSYLGLRFIGTSAGLIAGIPVLIWLTVGVSVLIIGGLFVSLLSTDSTEEASKMTVEGEAKES
jgi:hypothetical protein